MMAARRSGSFALLMLGGLGMSFSAFAEDMGSDKGGLPQLDTSLFPEQLFWLAISFSVLYILMSTIALPKVAQTQGKRKEIIASELEAAQKASETAKATIADLEKSLAQARARAQENVSTLMATVVKESAARQASQEHDLLRKLRWAEEEIAVERQAALERLGQTSAELGSLIVEKVLGLKTRSGA